MSGSPQLRGADGEPVRLTLPVRRRLQLDEEGTPAQPQPGALPQAMLVKRIRYIFEVKQGEQLERLPRMLERNAGK